MEYYFEVHEILGSFKIFSQLIAIEEQPKYILHI